MDSTEPIDVLARSAAPRARLVEVARQNSMLLILVAMVVIATVVSGGIFLQPSNLATVLFQASVLGVLAVGQAVVILSGGLDLSIGVVALFAAVLAGLMSDPTQTVLPRLPIGLAIPIALLAGVAFGVLNGAFAAFTRMPMFIVTLATSLVCGSVILLVSGGGAIEPEDPFWLGFGSASIFGLPLPVFVWAGVIVAASLWLKFTTSGRQSLFVGSAPMASLFSGVPVVRVRFIAYAICGLLAGAAGLLFLARTGSIVPGAQGSSLVLDSIAAVVIGGISLRGGQGRIIDSAIGVLVLATLTNLLALQLIQPRSQSLFIGAVVLVAAWINVRVTARRGKG
jgi:ribose/xylose/arabinose/galactoside ABC-type transport system permease subunit